MAHGPSCSAACGILPDQGSNPCPLHWQADSQPLRHQGIPGKSFLSLGMNQVTPLSSVELHNSSQPPLGISSDMSTLSVKVTAVPASSYNTCKRRGEEMSYFCS